LESLLGQTYKNFEVILVNDRSTGKMSSVVNKYKHKFGHQFKLFHNQANHGAPYSRNKGFKMSKGEYVLFCDADVIMRPDMLEMMLKTLKDHPEASYAYSTHRFGRKKFDLWEFSEEKLKQMPYIHSTSLIRREHFPARGWDETLKRLQDWDLWLKMLEEGHRGKWINEELFKVLPGGTMSGWIPSFFYKVFPFLPKVKKYKNAVSTIKEKHNLG
jgi:glycosyltransferase involved in cell wall biosynthesis